MMKQLLLLIALSYCALTISLLRTLTLCSQVLNVQQIQQTPNNSVCYFCRNDVDRDEPIRFYNWSSNSSFQLPKNKNELVSTFNFAEEANILAAGYSNSSVIIFDLHNKRQSFMFHNVLANVLVEGVALSPIRQLVLWVGIDGKLCLGSWLRNITNCILAHSFNATAIEYREIDGLVLTCGGDRTCKSWRIQQPQYKLILVKTYMLSKTTKVNTIICSQHTILVGGSDGSQFINLQGDSRENHLNQIATFGIVCGKVVGKSNTLLSISPEGWLITTDLGSGNIKKQTLGERVLSCSFSDANKFVTGHLKGVSKFWQI